MNAYYTYEFISPEPLFAKIREELKTYFESGSLDDTLFPLWVNWTLRKLTRGTLPIRTSFLEVVDGVATVPEDFKYPREIWSLERQEKTFSDPTVTYVKAKALRLDSPDIRCNPCTECQDPPQVEAIYKITSQKVAQFSYSRQLHPGKILDPGFPCKTEQAADSDLYELDGRSLKVNFPVGTLYLAYYAELFDEKGFQLIPDDVYIMEALEYHIRFKLMEMLFNQAADESFNQTRYKKEEAERSYLEKFVIAQTWMKKPTQEQRRQAHQKHINRLNKYKFR